MIAIAFNFCWLALIYLHYIHTLKNSLVEPEATTPYLISVCLARSSADSIGDCIRSTVKNAAKLAVYDEIMMRVKNHQTLPTTRPEIDLYKEEVMYLMEFFKLETSSIITLNKNTIKIE